MELIDQVPISRYQSREIHCKNLDVGPTSIMVYDMISTEYDTIITFCTMYSPKNVLKTNEISHLDMNDFINHSIIYMNIAL